MLHIYYGIKENSVFDTDGYFDLVFEDEWFESETVKAMVKDVDRSEVVAPHIIESPVLGPITPRELSGGVKTLILMLCDDSHIYNASNCGDNCAKWIAQIGRQKELTISLGHIMDFSGVADFEAEIVNDHTIVRSYRDYVNTIVTLEQGDDRKI